MATNVVPLVSSFFSSIKYFKYLHNQVSSRSLSHGMRSSYDDSPRSCGPIALPNGTIQVRLRNGIRFGNLVFVRPTALPCIIFNFRVYLTLDKSIRLTNSRSRITMSLSSNGGSAALIHPNGKVYQFGSFVEIVAYDGNETNNYVYVWLFNLNFTWYAVKGKGHPEMVYLAWWSGGMLSIQMFLCNFQ